MINIIASFGGKLTDRQADLFWESLQDNTSKMFKFIPVAQDEKWAERLKAYNPIVETSYNFSKAYNAGINRALDFGGYALIVNSDTILGKGWDLRLIDALETLPNCGGVQPCSNSAYPGINAYTEKLNFNIDDMHLIETVNHAANDCYGIDWKDKDGKPIPAYWPARELSGFCMLFRLADLYAVRLPNRDILDSEAFNPIYGEDNDLCYRIKGWLGKSLYIVNTAYVHHWHRTCAPDNRDEIQERAVKTLNERIKNGYYDRRVNLA